MPLAPRRAIIPRMRCLRPRAPEYVTGEGPMVDDATPAVAEQFGAEVVTTLVETLEHRPELAARLVRSLGPAPAPVGLP